MAIGIFDSGVGGLTVFSSLADKFKKLNMHYLGDTARVPYGSRSKDTVIRYSLECTEYLVKNCGIEALVVACNTASSFAIEEIRKTFGIPVIGVVRPGSENAVGVTKTGRIGVIGTRGTIRSGAYKDMLESMSNGVKYQIFDKPCPIFVPLVEELMIDNKIAELAVHEYLDELAEKDIDTLILGCTHYPILKNLISEIYPQWQIVDSSIAILKYVEELDINMNEEGSRHIYVTDESPAFERLKNVLIGDTPTVKISL